MEAEDFLDQVPGSSTREWQILMDGSASNSHCVYIKEYGENFNTSESPRLDFPVTFTNDGEYHVWVRMKSFNDSRKSDGIYIGVDGSSSLEKHSKSASFEWWEANLYTDNIFISSSGDHTINLWASEDGVYVDKIIITSDHGFEPISSGPQADQMLKDDAKSITRFALEEVEYPVEGVINEMANTINITAAYGTDKTNLVPVIEAPYGAVVTPSSGVAQDFSNPVAYEVEALDGSTRNYTVSVTVLGSESTEKEITRFYLEPLEQEAAIDNINNEIEVTYNDGYSYQQSVTIEHSQFSMVTATSKNILVPGEDKTYTVTAQDGSERVYTIIYIVEDGVQSFSDDFSTADNVSNWDTDGGNFNYSHNATDEKLDLQCVDTRNKWSGYDFSSLMNLANTPIVRMRLTTNKSIGYNGVEAYLKDADGNRSSGIEINVLSNTLYELEYDFSNSLVFSEDTNNKIDISRIDQLLLRIHSNGGTDASIQIDDFRAGNAALPNQVPVIDPVKKPDFILAGDGEQTIELTGIDDGDKLKDQTMSITATSSDESVVSTPVVNYDGTSSTGTITYSPGGARGFSTITVTVKDDEGRIYSDEMDSVSISFIVEVRDLSVNNPPSCDLPYQAKMKLGTGQNVIILPSVSDGDADKSQNLTITATSLDESLLVIDSVVHDTMNNIALLYVTEQAQASDVEVQIDITDDGGSVGDGNDSFSTTFTVSITGFPDNGVIYKAYDKAFWQPMPYNEEPPVFNQTILSSTAVTDELVGITRDMFWMKMYGYIVPKVTGDYVFQTFDHEGSYVYLSTDQTKENIPDQENPTAWYSGKDPKTGEKIGKTQKNSDPINLEAGKYYYFEFFAKEVVLGFNHKLNWTGPGIPNGPITSEYLVAEADFVLPDAPENLQSIKTGTHAAIVDWEEATDNNKVIGYDIFVDGYKVNDEMIKGLEYTITGLNPNRKYTVTVRAMDKLGNLSDPSNLLNITTYQVDNTPPDAPQNVVSTEATGGGIKITWDEVTDGETAIWGYNVYFDGQSDSLNAGYIRENYFWVTGLDQSTSYDFRVTAIDAGFNESLPSDMLTASTTKFCADCPQDGVKKGRVKVTLEPMSKSIGHMLQWSANFASNGVKFPDFETSDFDDANTDEKLEKLGKEKAGNVIFKIVKGDQAYDGERSAKLTGGTGSYFRSRSSMYIYPEDDYMVKLAAKKDDTYQGPATVRVSQTFNNRWKVLFEQDFVPMDYWQEFTFVFPVSEKEGANLWDIEIIFQDAGNLFVDNVEFHNYTHYDSTTWVSGLYVGFLEELEVAGVRMGGAPFFNYKNLSGMTGPSPAGNLYSYGDVTHISNKFCDGYSTLNIGYAPETDWRTEEETFRNLMEYYGGPTSSTWGAIRASEGYDDLMTDAEKILFEFGCEVWGKTHGDETFASQPAVWGEWVRDRTRSLKTSPYHDPEKIVTSYSDYYWRGIHEVVPMLEGENGEVDWVDQSGYVKNSNSAVEIVEGEATTILGYYQEAWEEIQDYISKLHLRNRLMLTATGRVLPSFIYEGNFTPQDNNGKLGQAVVFTDWYAESYEAGAAVGCVFGLDHANWKILEPANYYFKRPQYYATSLFNKYCKGTILKTGFETGNVLNKFDGTALALDPVGCHTYVDSTRYTIMLTGRDFAEDYLVQVDLPDELNSVSSTAKKVVMTGPDMNGKQTTITEEDISFGDSTMVTVPKYSLVFIVFEADKQDLPEVSMGNLVYQPITSIDVVPVNASDFVIDENNGRLTVTAHISPDDAYMDEVGWKFIDNNIGVIGGFFGNDFIMMSSGKSSGNGTVTLRAYAYEDTTVYKDITITISNQGTNIEEKANDKLDDVLIYPVPFSDIVTIVLNQTEYSNIKLFDIQGRMIKQKKLNSNINELNLSHLSDGMYFIKLEGESGVLNRTIIKE